MTVLLPFAVELRQSNAKQTYMSHERITLQPNLRRLLELEALSEAQVVYGDHFLQKQISQVTAQIYGGQKEGTLAVLRADTLGQQEVSSFKGMSGLILIKPVQSSSSSAAKGNGRSQVVSEIELEPVIKLCTEASTPLIILPSLEDSREITEEIRAAYLSEVKKASARLHTSFIRIVIEEGLDAFVLELSEVLGRPVAVETADFKLISAENMGQTPANQQKTITEEIGEALNRELRSSSTEDPDETLEVVRVGRRLVAAVILEGAVVGYLSVMLRPNDDEDLIGEYLRPAVLAVLVDFSQRRREFSAGSVGHKSLLKDLLSGHSLAASDQERLYQYFGLDICDGSLVFAVRLIPDDLARSLSWTEERQAMVDMEGAKVFVVPYESKKERSWKDYAEELKESIRKKVDGLKIQIGAGRMAEGLLDVADSYREARQALITGSMIHSDEEFVIGYNELGIKRLLYLVIDHPELERFYEDHLAPLEAYDEEWETELVPTLRVYLQEGYNLNSAAKELFIHRHTMRYRLEQIAELLKVDIDSPEVLLNLQIAFNILEMKGKTKS